MSKLDDILDDPSYMAEGGTTPEVKKQQIKDLIRELIGDVEQRETEDMSLNSWTPEDYKAFGKNELKIELRRRVNEL